MSNITFRNDVNISWISTAILIILAVFGVGIGGITIGNFDTPPFILYLGFHVTLMLLIMTSRSEYILDIPRPLLMLLFFALYVTGSIFWAETTISILKQMVLVVTSLLIGFLVYWTVPHRRALSRYISILKLLFFIGVIIATFEIITGIHLPISKRAGTDSWYVASAWYVNRNNFGMFLTMVSFFFFADALPLNEIRTRLLGVGGFVTCLTIMVKNNSRSATFAMIIVGVLLLVIYISRDKISRLAAKRTRFPIFTIIALLGALSIVGLVLFMSNPFEPQGSRSLWFRWRSLELGVILLFDTILGSGVGSFPAQWGQIAPPPDTGINLHVGANSHNWFATLIGEYGLVGTVLFLLAYGRTADVLLERYLRDRDPMALGLLGALLSFTLAGLGPNNPMKFQILWIVFGLSIAFLYRVSN